MHQRLCAGPLPGMQNVARETHGWFCRRILPYTPFFFVYTQAHSRLTPPRIVHSCVGYEVPAADPAPPVRANSFSSRMMEKAKAAKQALSSKADAKNKSKSKSNPPSGRGTPQPLGAQVVPGSSGGVVNLEDFNPGESLGDDFFSDSSRVVSESEAVEVESSDDDDVAGGNALVAGDASDIELSDDEFTSGATIAPAGRQGGLDADDEGEADSDSESPQQGLLMADEEPTVADVHTPATTRVRSHAPVDGADSDSSDGFGTDDQQELPSSDSEEDAGMFGRSSNRLHVFW